MMTKSAIVGFHYSQHLNILQSITPLRPFMTSSMTSFTRQHAECEWGSLVWEIRSVNHRYLDASIRLPDYLRNLEGKIRDLIRAKISRGKVDAQLKLSINPDAKSSMQLNIPLLDQLLATENQLRTKIYETGPTNLLDLLKWPGVLQEPEQNTNAIETETLTLFETALNQFQENRLREGKELNEIIQQRIESISQITVNIRDSMPDIIARQKEKLQTQISELILEQDPQRLEQEIVMLSQKADIQEEIYRLETHVKEVLRILKSNDAVGRRLDFLMQELNREANTICSKAIVTETTFNAVELKVLIEQMREQIQNIE